MEYGKALNQISEIHQHLARTEVYRGYRPVPVALSGIVGLAAAAWQPASLSSRDPVGFVVFWTSVAAIAGLVGCAEIVVNYLLRESPRERRRTRVVIGQFAPCIAVGVVMTVALTALSPDLVPILPGTWALLFGLAVVSARPYLPRATGWVALYYFVAGTWLLGYLAGQAPSPWTVGGTFGTGQLLSALVLYWNLERRHDWAAEP